jgi:DNA-binding SARP family transcriptional activator
MLEVRLAGGLSVSADGTEMALPSSRRARSLLAYLALHPGPQPRAQLAARFWPDVLDESARTSLRAALTELRQALGPAAGCVVATRETVALEGDDLHVDVRAFDRALAAGDPVRALAVCDGSILDGLDDDWVHEARRAHAEALSEALERVAAAASEPAEAVRLTRAQLALDPLAEPANRRLIERLDAAGDRAAALAAGRQFADRLRAELGIVPSRETRALLDGLRRGDAAPVRPPPSLMRSYDTEFVGRRAELDRLRASWGGVQMHPDRRIVLLAGEPGVGKTRLAHEFALRALNEGGTILYGRCSEEPLAPYEPFAEALQQAGLADVLRPSDADDTGARHRLFDAVDLTLTDLATHAAVLIVVDDLQWADRGTLLLTSFLLRSARPGPLLILGSYRDTELGRGTPLTGALGELQRSGGLDRIGLRGLGTDDVAALTRSLLGSDDVAAHVHARTNGNAFFVEEVLRGLADARESDVPESVRHSVGLRLARMSGDAAELLDAAAILGLEHDARALEITAGLEPPAAESALDEILSARLLRPAPSASQFEFTHALVREAVLHECNALRRARLHRQAAAALTTLGEDRHVEEIAMHLFEAASAADAERAAEMSVRAARRALERLAYEDAADHFARARDALELAGDDGNVGPILLGQGDALLRAGGRDASRSAFTAARELALRRDDTRLLAEAALGFTGLGIAILDLDADAIARLEEALERTDDDVLRSRLQARLAIELYYAPDRSRSDTLSADAVASARHAGDPGALAAALNARHVALWRPDRVEERIAVAREMISAAREAGQRHSELQARNWLVTDLFELGDMTACREEIARHGRLADELRLPVFQWYTPLWAAVEAILAGRFEEGERLSFEAEDAGTRAGDRNAELFPPMLRYIAQLEREEFADTDLTFVEDKIAHSPAGPAYRAGYSWALAGRGERERAREQLDAAMTYPHPFDANWLSCQAECAATSIILQDATYASVLYERLEPYAGRPATAARAVSSYGAIDMFLGRLAVLLGRHDDAVRHLRAAVRRNNELGCPVWAYQSQRALAAIAPEDPLATVTGIVTSWGA